MHPFRTESVIGLVLRGNAVDENGHGTLPGVQVVAGDSSRAQGFDQELAEFNEGFAGDAAFLVAVSHVVDVAQKLELVVHGGDDDIEAVSDEGNLLVELGIGGQSTVGNLGELGEVLLEAGSASKEPIEFKCNSVHAAISE